MPGLGGRGRVWHSDRMVNLVRRWLPLALIAVVAWWLRTHELGARPMHADEANQAVKFGALLEHGEYRFDPQDHHGPTLYYAALLPAWMCGEKTLAELTETTVRLTPAIFGVLGVLLVYLLAKPLGEGTALAAAAFAALAPPAVYYGRDFIQETLLVTFTLGGIVCGQRWWRTGQVRWAIGVGACAGLMLATKESALVFIVAAAIALVAARKPASRKMGRDLMWAAGTALLVAAVLYSSFFTNPVGGRDAAAAIAHGFSRATAGATGHEKPWWYYLRLLTFQRGGGHAWDETLFILLAVAGAVVAWRARSRVLRFMAIYTGVLAIAISLTPYKTPWIVVNLIPGLAVLSAGALAALVRQGRGGRIVAVGLFVGTVTELTWQTRLVALERPADPHNPFAYVQSSPDVLKVPALARRVGDGTIKVIGEEYWPLPWYLRASPKVGYWNAPPEDCDAALVFATSAQADAVRARLHGRYREDFLGLRPGVLLVVFTREP